MIASAEETVYVSEIDWLELDDSLFWKIERYDYNWKTSIEDYKNRERIYNPATFGLPSDTVFLDGVGIIEWTFIKIEKPKYAVGFNGKVYTNSSIGDVTLGALKRPKKGFSREYFSREDLTPVTVSEITINKTDISVKVTCEWYTKKKRYNRPGFKKIYHSQSKTISTGLENIQYDFNEWPTIIPDQVNATITNHSGRYSTLKVDLPKWITGININILSDNKTKTYNRTNYACWWNSTEKLFNMTEHKISTQNGICSYGNNSFLIYAEKDYDLNITVSTPFEDFDLNLSIDRIDEVDKEGGDWSILAGTLGSIGGLYILLRFTIWQ